MVKIFATCILFPLVSQMFLVIFIFLVQPLYNSFNVSGSFLVTGGSFAGPTCVQRYAILWVLLCTAVHTHGHTQQSLAVCSKFLEPAFLLSEIVADTQVLT